MKKTKGFSIVELMVAITVGLLILVGVIQIFVLNRGNFRLQNGYAVMQESAQYLNDYMGRYLRLAGYRSTPVNNAGYLALNNLFTTENPYITGTTGTGVNGSDTLTVRYQGSGTGTGAPDGTVVDCFNVGVDSGQTTTLTFSISGNLTLQCQTPNATADILPNVENMHVLYGEDTDADGIPNRFVPSAYVGINWQNIVAVRISLLFISNNGDSPTVNANSYNLLGTLYGPVNDYKLRLQTTTTIQLRNRLAGSS